MDGNEKARRRREEAAKLRQVANSAAPRAYQDPKHQALTLEDLDPNDKTKGMDNTVVGNVVDLYGAFTKDNSWRTRPISTAVSLSSYVLAYILLLIVLSVAQCSWWYEPGMYSDNDARAVAHGR